MNKRHKIFFNVLKKEKLYHLVKFLAYHSFPTEFTVEKFIKKLDDKNADFGRVFQNLPFPWTSSEDLIIRKNTQYQRWSNAYDDLSRKVYGL